MKNGSGNSITRRNFVKAAAAGSAVLAAPAVTYASSPQLTSDVFGKDGLLVLGDRPLNAETPAHLLDDLITPTSRMFVRNNGIPPTAVNRDAWQLVIEGESVVSTRSWSIAGLKERFAPVDLQITVECGGNGRAEFDPPASGNQWTLGAVGCPLWHGVRLRDVLIDAGLKDDAVYIGYYGADTHLSGDPSKAAISRGVPVWKALEPEAMIAWGMNNGDLHAMNGHPLRLVIGGWPGSTSGKWLNRIVVRNQVHDGAKMGGTSYRVPDRPVAPGTEVAEESMQIIESMPVKSLITSPQTGSRHLSSSPVQVRGHAWAGDRDVSSVFLSADYGQTWQPTTLSAPANRFAWQHFKADLQLSGPGYHELWAKAVDSAGLAQPMVLPGWNPKGYLNNAAHRIAIYAS